MQTLELIPQPLSCRDNSVRATAVLKRRGQDDFTLWFDVPAGQAEKITSNADPFLLGMLFLIMQDGAALRVRGTVSPSLLRNLDTFAGIWRAWYPDLYQPLNIHADVEQEAQSRQEQTAALISFSGGVDSCFSVMRHMHGDIGRRSQVISGAVFSHGFADVPLGQDAVFDLCCQHNRELLGSLGIELIPVKTNILELPLRGRHVWAHCHGCAIAAQLSLLANGFSCGLVPNSIPFNRIHMRYGSSPLITCWLSSGTFPLIDDGGDASRLQKTAALAHWPEALRHLRVCNTPTSSSLNCGVCEKCVRTILSFRVVGQGLPPCFGRDVSLDDISRLDVRYPSQHRILTAIIREAEIRGTGNEPWVKQLGKVLRRDRRRRLIRQLRHGVRPAGT
jgi:hypothetical protein